MQVVIIRAEVILAEVVVTIIFPTTTTQILDLAHPPTTNHSAKFVESEDMLPLFVGSDMGK